MKIILRPTNPTAPYAAPIISITTPGDGMVLSDALEQLIVPALIAYGYHPQAIQDCFRDFEVPGATQEKPLVDSCEPFEVPEGFVYAGYDTYVDGDFASEDVLYRDDIFSPWQTTTRFINGGEVFYAVREGSAAHTAVLESL
jgi:hypothetical protein